MSRSDAELLEGIQNDDQDAWTEFVRRHTGLVWATARAQGLDPQTAADVVQETWISILQYRFTIVNPDAIRGWLVITTRREAVRVSKKQRRQVPSELTVTIADPTSAEQQSQIDDQDQVATLRRAFARLSEACQELLSALFSSADRPYDQIAADLGRPIGSLGPTRKRCLEKLKELYTEVASPLPSRHPEVGRER